MTLADITADSKLLLSLPPEQVGLQLLKLAAQNLQNGIFTKESVAGRENLFGGGYSSRKRSTGTDEPSARMRHTPTPVHRKPHN